MAEMKVISLRLSSRDLRDLDRLRGGTDRSRFLRRLLRAEAKREWPTWPVDDNEPDDGPAVSDEDLERLNRLSRDDDGGGPMVGFGLHPFGR
jgi:hypothetical protein